MKLFKKIGFIVLAFVVFISVNQVVVNASEVAVVEFLYDNTSISKDKIFELKVFIKNYSDLFGYQVDVKSEIDTYSFYQSNNTYLFDKSVIEPNKDRILLNKVNDDVATLIAIRNETETVGYTNYYSKHLFTIKFIANKNISNFKDLIKVTDNFNLLKIGEANFCLKLSNSSGEKINYTIKEVGAIDYKWDKDYVIESGSNKPNFASDIIITNRSGYKVEIDDISLDMKKPGNYNIVAKIIDEPYFQSLEIIKTVTIVDTTKPSIKLIGDELIEISLNQLFIDPGVEVSDNSSDYTIIVEGEVDNSKEGEYTITYTAKDSSNNTSSVSRIVRVVKKEFTVVFLDYDGTVLKTEIVNLNGTANAPSDPVRPATEKYTYVFKGWDKSYDNVTMNLEIKAIYEEIINKFTVTFYDSDGVTVLKTVDVEYGNSIKRPTDIIKDGYRIKGWYLDSGESFNFTTKITSDISLKAEWSKKFKLSNCSLGLSRASIPVFTMITLFFVLKRKENIKV